ncbi:MAG: hypothetical protein AAGA87_13895 [Pseudomonadota bacterium]
MTAQRLGPRHQPLLVKGWKHTTWRLCALLLMPTPATADTTDALKSALTRFTNICPQALADPDVYMATLARPGPAGEDAVYRSDDGQYVLVHTAQTEGITDYVEVSALGLRSCTISATIPNFPEAPEIADALRPMLTSVAETVVGGRVPLITPMWDPGESPEAFDSGDWFVFHMTGLWPDSDAVATAQVELGAVRFHVSALK